MRKIYTQLLAMCLAALFFNTCSNAENRYVFTGRIDERLVELSQSAPRTFTLEINSGGGLAEAAASASKILIKKDVYVVVYGRCMSACSEFILPSANRITFKNKPMIGFHWSPLMNKNQFERSYKLSHSCDFIGYDEQLRAFEKSGLNIEFWQYVEERLALENYIVFGSNNGCPNTFRRFTNRVWLPTSNQLREILNLQFDGDVCADDIDGCIEKVDLVWSAGDSVVIGNYVHVVGVE